MATRHFCFDNGKNAGATKRWLERPFRLAARTGWVTCGESRPLSSTTRFYRPSRNWLSDGWALRRPAQGKWGGAAYPISLLPAIYWGARTRRRRRHGGAASSRWGGKRENVPLTARGRVSCMSDTTKGRGKRLMPCAGKNGLAPTEAEWEGGPGGPRGRIGARFLGHGRPEAAYATYARTIDALAGGGDSAEYKGKIILSAPREVVARRAGPRPGAVTRPRNHLPESFPPLARWAFSGVRTGGGDIMSISNTRTMSPPAPHRPPCGKRGKKFRAHAVLCRPLSGRRARAPFRRALSLLTARGRGSEYVRTMIWRAADITMKRA